MMVQCFYEVGYIIYMCIDLINLLVDVIGMVCGFIEDEFGQKYLLGKVNVYLSKEGVQEVYEVICFFDVNFKLIQLFGMECDVECLYDLIWCQFVVCQMILVEYFLISVSVIVGDFELCVKGCIFKFDGYIWVLLQQSKLGEDDVLLEMKEGENFKLIKFDLSQYFIKLLVCYFEVSLVKELEKCGIGCFLIYVVIIFIIQECGYVIIYNCCFYVEKMGDIVIDWFNESFVNLMDYGFIVGMEEYFDDVVQGECDWKYLFDEFYGDFKKKFEVVEVSEKGMCVNQLILINIFCCECGWLMMICIVFIGVFFGCLGYSLLLKECCKVIVNLIFGDEIVVDDEGEFELWVLCGKYCCLICSIVMDVYLLDEKYKLYICGNNFDCLGYEIEEGQYWIKGYEGLSLECDKCGSEMQLKIGCFGKFFGCINLICKNICKLLKNGEVVLLKMDVICMFELKCEKVDDIYVLCDGVLGMFLVVSQFLKNCEICVLLVSEIILYKVELDFKYYYFCDVLQKDLDGCFVVICFSCKIKE